VSPAATSAAAGSAEEVAAKTGGGLSFVALHNSRQGPRTDVRDKVLRERDRRAKATGNSCTTLDCTAGVCEK
jgi:hypothetical protein